MLVASYPGLPVFFNVFSATGGLGTRLVRSTICIHVTVQINYFLLYQEYIILNPGHKETRRITEAKALLATTGKVNQLGYSGNNVHV